MGPVGGVLMIIMLFMAIVSTGSAECIAVSSLWSYDVYRKYINPNASGKQILLQSRIMVCIWAIVMAVASIVLNAMGLSLGWVYNFMGICIGSAVPPIAMVVTSKNLGANGAITAAVTGMIFAVFGWFAQAGTYDLDGDGSADGITVDTTGQLYAQLTGNMLAIGVSSIICFFSQLLFPMNFDWDVMIKGITLVGGDGGEDARTRGAEWESTPEFLNAAKAWIWKYGVLWTGFLTIVWPVLSIPFGVFGKSTYQLWASVALVWGWTAGLTIISLPIYENLPTICRVLSCKPMPAGGGDVAVKTVESAAA
jgi:hypothetical protein